MPVQDLALSRITALPDLSTYIKPSDIEWPAKLGPKTISGLSAHVDHVLPKVDAVVMMYTSAEGIASADVLSPGLGSANWSAYTHNLSKFEKHYTSRSPAREAKCMARVTLVKIGPNRVLLVKSNLHLSTDDETIPVMALVQQIIAETGCRLFISTGTAGGVGTEVLGDVIFANNTKMNMAKSPWAKETWAQESYATLQPTEAQLEGISKALELLPPKVAGQLKPSGYADRAPSLIQGRDIQTVGYFAYADNDDSFGIMLDDPNTGCEEMDDAIAARAVSLIPEGQNKPAFVAIRNASDPQMKDGSAASKALAEKIYIKYGYWTTVCSSMVVWATLAYQAA